MRALPQLFANNRAWAQARTQGDPDFFRRLARQQAPDYLWIGCSDSRVPANEIVGLPPGEMFVQRNVANVVVHTDLNCLSVIQYAVDALKVRHIIVCGHYGCGGVQRALVTRRGAMLDHWLQPISMLHRKHLAVFDAIADPGARLGRLCEINIEMQVRRLAQTPIVENAWTRGQPLNLHGWIYAIEDGLIRDLGPHLASLEDRDVLPSIDHRVLHPVEPVSALRRQALAAFGAEGSDGVAACTCACAGGEAPVTPATQASQTP